MGYQDPKPYRNCTIGVTFEAREDLQEIQEEISSNMGVKFSMAQTVAFLIADYRRERP
tara:strand:- start:182 stop:355 length:174 start_codon:yes stop_codon:yes gene_type:complete